MKFITNVRDAEEVIENGKVMAHKGDSICVTCGTAMPVCWNASCSVCGATICYAHAKAKDNYWYCLEHYPKEEASEEILVSSGNSEVNI